MNKEEFSGRILALEKSLYYIARSVLNNDEDCKDAIQNAILKAYKNLDTLREETFFKTWITRILLNECYNIHKWNKKLVSYEEYMEQKYEDGQVACSEVYIEIQNLEEKYRVPFVLHYVEGFSLQEVAKLLKTTEAAVKMRLLRARKILREQLVV